jgi:hypothetical protein
LWEFLEVSPENRDWNEKGRAIVWQTGHAATLPSVYAATKTGQNYRHLKSRECAQWAERLLIDAGLLEPAPLGSVKKLPTSVGADDSRRLVYSGFLLLLGIRWLAFPGDHVAFGRRFAAPWCGVSEKQFALAWGWLKKNRYVEQVGWTKVRGFLWLPAGDEHPTKTSSA